MKTESRIYIGSDHAGFYLKGIICELLKSQGYTVVDAGPLSYDPNDDYPDYAKRVCTEIIGTDNKGILICGSGQGMDRVANKFPGIYASVCWNTESARIAKEHGDVNVLCLAGRMINQDEAKSIVKTWIECRFSEEERHVRRIRKIKEVEEEQTTA